MSGDGRPDLLSRDTEGRVWLNASNGRLGVEPRVLVREKMFRTSLQAAAGRWNDDGTRDVIVRRVKDKALYLVPGKRDGTLGEPVLLAGGKNFGDYDQIVGVGDFNRDQRPDILAREKDTGRLWLFAGSPSGLRERTCGLSGMAAYELIG